MMKENWFQRENEFELLGVKVGFARDAQHYRNEYRNHGDTAYEAREFCNRERQELE